MRAALVGIGLLVVGLAGAVTWFLVRMIERDVFRVRERNDPLDLEVVEVLEGAIRLKPLSRDGAKELRRPGTYGFEFDGGYAQCGPILEMADDPWAPVMRAATSVRGVMESGTRGRMDSFSFQPDPATLGLAWEQVGVSCAGGEYPAWLLRRDAARWAIFVHGKAARHEEALRILPVVQAESWTCLVIAYRNDVGCAGEGVYRFGADEWEDLEAAAQFATTRGASDIVLVGYSMGAGIALSFMQRSSLAPAVRGLILDSPMSDLGTLLELRLKERRVPAVLARAGSTLAGRRAGMRLADAGYHRHDVAPPILVLHGDDDDVIPIELSERFVEDRENARFVRIPGAGHVRGWNVDRDTYESAVREFLRDLSEPRSEGSGCSPPIRRPKD